MAPIRQILLLIVSIQSVLCEEKYCGVQKFKPNLKRATYARSRRSTGEYPVKHSWPWAVFVNNGCSGVLINPNNHPTESDIVLTARHCNTYDENTVLFGSNGAFEVSEESREWVKVKSVIPHRKIDMAILKLETPIVFNDFIQPACLPDQPPCLDDAKISDPNGCYGVGFGTAQATGNPFDATLRQLSLPEIQNYDWPQPEEIYAKNREGGAMCGGDSGGPYLCVEDNKWVTFGILSQVRRGPECSNNTAVYHSTVYALEWIKENSRVSV